jgi:hypothetical protein
MGKRTLTTYRTYGLTVLHSIPCISLNTYLPHYGHRIHIIKGINSDHNSRHKDKEQIKEHREINPNPITLRKPKDQDQINHDKKEHTEIIIKK